MQKLVLSYSSGDGCTYSCDNNLPFYAESKIAAELELLEIWQDWRQRVSNSNGSFVTSYIKFHGHELDFGAFTYRDDKTRKVEYVEPTIQTLEEWFDNHLEEKL
jgi:hypothetical protein